MDRDYQKLPENMTYVIDFLVAKAYVSSNDIEMGRVKVFLAAFVLAVVFCNMATAQPMKGQQGVICTSYNQCSDVEIGYFVFPSPAKDILYIDLTSREEANLLLDIYGTSGRPLGGFEQKATVKGRASLQMRIANLSSGFYYLHIKDMTRETLEIIKFQKE